MSFDPKRPYILISNFDDKKPFERIVFDPNRPYEVVNEFLGKLKVKTLKEPIVSPPKRNIFKGKFVEPLIIEKKGLSEDDILKLIRGEISTLPKPKPQKVIEKVIEKEIIKEVKKEEKKDDKRIKELENEIENLRGIVERIKNVLPTLGAKGGSGVIGIPNPEGQNEKVLTVENNQAIWKTSTAASSNADPLYIGDPETDGSWRFTIVGTTLSHQRRESGTWVEKGADLG